MQNAASITQFSFQSSTNNFLSHTQISSNMKTLQIIFALVVILTTSFMANAQDSFNGMKASILRPTDPQLVSYAKLHEAANLQLDVKNVQKIIINENANIACLVYPIIGGKYEVPSVLRNSKNTLSFFAVYYNPQNTKSYKTVLLHTGTINSVINHEEQYAVMVDLTEKLTTLVSYDKQSLTQRINFVNNTTNTNVTTYSYSSCVDGNYNGIKGVVAGTAAGSCVAGNVFGCGFSVGWFLGTAAVCAFSAT